MDKETLMSFWLTVDEVAVYTRRSPDTVRAWLAGGRLIGFRDGKRGTLVAREDVDRFIRSWKPTSDNPPELVSALSQR